MTNNNVVFLATVVCIFRSQLAESGILYPRASETREILSLDGLWNFRFNDAANQTKYTNTDLNLMAVPASYNDISTHDILRDYVGIVIYTRSFFVPQSWKNQRVWIRFGSVVYNATVLINGKFAVTHELGHFPFGVEVSSLVNFGKKNVIEVQVDNTMTLTTLPQGEVKKSEWGRNRLIYHFDYFQYAGIERSVLLYTSNEVYVDDISILTTISNTTGIVNFTIDIVGSSLSSYSLETSILDSNEKIVNTTSNKVAKTISGQFQVSNAKFWWPYLMNDIAGYQYTLRVDILDANKELVDRYDQKFGIRELAWDNNTFRINGKNIYIRGFGRHEEQDTKGKGLDLPFIIRDHNLIKWTGANCYRTSHYPYSEEIMDLVDEMGIMIIDEVPAINTGTYTEGLLATHKKALTELHQRDKNRPSVIAWSVANEPATAVNESENYYRQVVAHLKTLDTSRASTIVIAISYDDDHAAQFVDITCFNRYIAWYLYGGELNVIFNDTVYYATAWRNKHNKPVIMSEYGADTIQGFHSLPEVMWTEEYQEKLMEEQFKAFDFLRAQGWFIGEMIWNFADFKTAEREKRVNGNRKGLFTRDRQPKSAAFLLRKRYWSLAKELDKVSQIPNDLEDYITTHVIN